MPDPVGYMLSSQDAALIRRFMSAVRRLPSSSFGDPGRIEHEEQPSPEMHLFRVPSGGIAARTAGEVSGTSRDEVSDDVISSVDCEVWRIIHGEDDIEERFIQPAGVTYRLHNPFSIRVPGEDFVLGWRDKYGDWWVDRTPEFEVGTGTGEVLAPGHCDLLTVNWDDCVLVTGTDASVVLNPTGGGFWASTEDLSYFGGTSSGPVAVWVEGGRIHISVDGLELLDCENGKFSGGPITGHYPETGVPTGTGTLTRTPCAGETFYVTLSCTCCSIPGWGGPGWYCVRDANTYGTGTPYACVVVELLEEDRCDDTIEICLGPYLTEEEATTNCYSTYPPSGTGTDVITTVEGCGGVYPAKFCVTVTGVGGDTPAGWIGFVFEVNYAGGTSWQTTGGVSPDPSPTPSCSLEMYINCVSGGNFEGYVVGDVNFSPIPFTFSMPSGGPFSTTSTIVDPLIQPPPCAFDELNMDITIEGC